MIIMHSWPTTGREQHDITDEGNISNLQEIIKYICVYLIPINDEGLHNTVASGVF